MFLIDTLICTSINRNEILYQMLTFDKVLPHLVTMLVR